MTEEPRPQPTTILTETSDTLAEQVKAWQAKGVSEPDDSLCRAVLEWVDSVRGMVVDLGLDEEYEDLRMDFLMHLRKRKAHLGELDLNEPAWHWFSQVFRNFLRDRRRLRSRRAHYDTIGLDSLAGGHPASDAPSPFDELAARELFAFIQQHLSGLNGEVLKLTIAGLMPKEIAERLDLPRGTVRMRLSRAREELRVLLARLD